MFLRNTTDKDIGTITHEGFEFTLPANRVCAIWDSVGEVITQKLYNPKKEGGVTPVLLATEDEWDGKTYATVARYKIDPKNIPNRADMLKIAEKRGIDTRTLEKMRNDEGNWDNDEIANEINNLPIPEEIRFPEQETVKITKEVTDKDTSIEAPVVEKKKSFN